MKKENNDNLNIAIGLVNLFNYEIIKEIEESVRYDIGLEDVREIIKGYNSITSNKNFTKHEIYRKVNNFEREVLNRYYKRYVIEYSKVLLSEILDELRKRESNLDKGERLIINENNTLQEYMAFVFVRELEREDDKTKLPKMEIIKKYMDNIANIEKEVRTWSCEEKEILKERLPLSYDEPLIKGLAKYR